MVSLIKATLLVVFLLALSLLAPPASAHWKKHHGGHHRYRARYNITNELIFDACKTAPYRNLCFQTFALSSNANSCTSIQALAGISVSVAMESVVTTSLRIDHLLNTFQLPFLQHCLGGCSRSYLSVSKELGLAVWVLGKQQCSKSEVILSLKAAMSEVSSCQRSFSLDFSEKKTLSASNGKVLKLCANAIAIVNLLP